MNDKDSKKLYVVIGQYHDDSEVIARDIDFVDLYGVFDSEEKALEVKKNAEAFYKENGWIDNYEEIRIDEVELNGLTRDYENLYDF